MGTRFLTFHRTEPSGNEVRMSPSAYYIERGYTPVAVRIYAETAPLVDALVDTFDDGVSIFNNRTSRIINPISGVNQSGAAVTAVSLPEGTRSEEHAEDFSASIIAEGSWVYATLVCGGGRNFSVQLELHSEDEEATEE